MPLLLARMMLLPPLLLLLELVLPILGILQLDKAAALCVLLLLGALVLAHRLARLFVERLVCLAVRSLLLHTMMRLSMLFAASFGVESAHGRALRFHASSQEPRL